jgi:hypothetical protein
VGWCFQANTSVCGAYVMVVGTCVGVPQDGIYCLQFLFLGVGSISLMGLVSPTATCRSSFLFNFRAPLWDCLTCCLPYMLPMFPLSYSCSSTRLSQHCFIHHQLSTPLVKRFYNLGLTTSHCNFIRLPTFSYLEYY